jgi:peptidoglycan/xylan/chitin deacetylase (PgdA/CDA1 family)
VLLTCIEIASWRLCRSNRKSIRQKTGEGNFQAIVWQRRFGQRGKVIKRIIKLLIAIAFRGFEKLGALFCLTNNKPGTCVVLMYHDVTAANYHRFVRQMENLARLATPVATDSISELLKGKHFVAVTFDDGFASTIEMVLPFLENMAIPATFFIPTAYWGKEAAWITNVDRRKRVGRIITADSLRLLAKHKYVTIGSHGINHRRLTEMKDDEAQSELAESKKLLENITGKAVKGQSFPFGAYDDRHVAIARKAGYDHVFTVDPTIVNGGGEFVIGRIEVDPADWPLEFTLKVLGAYRWQPFVSRLKKRLWSMHSPH